VKKISNQDNFHWTSVSAIINLHRLTVHQLIKTISILKKSLLFFVIRIEEAQISRCYYKIIEKQKIRYRILKNFNKYLFNINQINILTHIFTIACMKHIHLLSKAKICKKLTQNNCKFIINFLSKPKICLNQNLLNSKTCHQKQRNVFRPK
jgi:hypothetical protein